MVGIRNREKCWCILENIENLVIIENINNFRIVVMREYFLCFYYIIRKSYENNDL